jgi:hypothetical protein
MRCIPPGQQAVKKSFDLVVQQVKIIAEKMWYGN